MACFPVPIPYPAAGGDPVRWAGHTCTRKENTQGINSKAPAPENPKRRRAEHVRIPAPG